MGEIELQDNRPSVYWEGNNLIIRASSIGHPCLFELIAIGQGEQTTGLSSNMYRAFGEGHAAEPLIIEELKEKHGVRFLSTQDEGELILPNQTFIRYHPDGIVFWEKLMWVAEIKNLSHDLWTKAVRNNNVGSVISEYPWQLSVMMHAERLPGVWIARNKGYPPDRKTGEKPFCEEQGKLFIQKVEAPPISLDEIKEKAEKVREGVLGEDVLESDRQCDTPNHFPCRFLYLRPEREEENMEDERILELSDEEYTEEFNDLVKQYLTFKGQHDETKKRYEAVRDQIVEFAGSNVKKVITDKWIVPILQSSSSRIAFEDMPDELRKEVEKYQVKKQGSRYVKGIKRRD